MPRTKVRTHKVVVNGKAHTRQSHGRETRGAKLKPSRAWRNAKRSRRAFKKNRKAAGILLGAAAVSEIAAFTVARSVGGVLFVVGFGLGALGYGMWKA